MLLLTDNRNERKKAYLIITSTLINLVIVLNCKTAKSAESLCKYNSGCETQRAIAEKHYIDKRYSEALGAYKSASMHAEDPAIIRNIGKCHMYLGELKEAREEFVKAFNNSLIDDKLRRVIQEDFNQLQELEKKSIKPKTDPPRQPKNPPPVIKHSDPPTINNYINMINLPSHCSLQPSADATSHTADAAAAGAPTATGRGCTPPRPRWVVPLAAGLPTALAAGAALIVGLVVGLQPRLPSNVPWIEGTSSSPALVTP